MSKTKKGRTVRVKVFKFTELSDKAKETAMQDYLSNGYEAAWTDENRQTLEAFEKVFPVDIKNWSYGGRGEGVYFSMTCDDAIEELTGQRLATYIWNNYRNDIYSKKWYNGTIRTKPNKYHLKNPHAPEFTTWSRYSKIKIESYNCPLTGYYMDNQILSPVWEFLDKPTNINFKELLEECFEAWVKACNNDIEGQQSEEYLTDHFDANNYEFTADGKRFYL